MGPFPYCGLSVTQTQASAQALLSLTRQVLEHYEKLGPRKLPDYPDNSAAATTRVLSGLLANAVPLGKLVWGPTKRTPEQEAKFVVSPAEFEALTSANVRPLWDSLVLLSTR